MKSRFGYLFLTVVLFGYSSLVLAQFEIRPWPNNTNAPPIEHTDISGQVFSSHELKGKVLLINFWATWCAPCTEELPSLQKLQEINQDKHLLVLTINNKESINKIRNFKRKNDMTLPVVTDVQGDITKQWGIKIFPTTVMLTGDGKPKWIVEGSADWTSKEISDLLAISPK